MEPLSEREKSDGDCGEKKRRSMWIKEGKTGTIKEKRPFYVSGSNSGAKSWGVSSFVVSTSSHIHTDPLSGRLWGVMSCLTVSCKNHIK